MIDNIINFFKKIFGKKTTLTTEKEIKDSKKYIEEYSQTIEFNPTAIISSNLTKLTLYGCIINIEPVGKRAEFLGNCLIDLLKKNAKILSTVLGTGGIVSVPVVIGNTIEYDLIHQDRLTIYKKQGDKIVSASIIADKIKVNNTNYNRVIDYNIVNNVLTIRYKTVDDKGEMAIVDGWGMEDITIGNVDRVPIAYFKCPTDNRDIKNIMGVPITFGGDDIIRQIKQNIKDVQKEYADKKTRIIASEHVQEIGIDGKVKITDDVINVLYGTDDVVLKSISEEIRNTAYEERQEFLFRLLEKHIDVSSGILSKNEFIQATATEIRRANTSTMAVISNIRTSFIAFVTDYIYACDVLAERFKLTPNGEYKILAEFKDPFEDTEKSYAMIKDMHSLGLVTDVEIRQFAKPDETIEQSQKIIEEIKQTAPSLSNLFNGE